ncbi:MAG TPA: efflux RND transporter permease subunit [Thermoanaerobaculia bacterium]|nr:efflux RND transporter permease subunit [Thermoanaerobaculia bacterium]
MIEQILRRPVSVIVATIALAALGGFALLKLPLSLLPQIERPSLVVTAKAASASRDELLQQVTAPIERRLAVVPGVISLESETRDGEARVTIGSAWQTDPDRLRIDVTRRIEGAAEVPLDDLSVETITDLTPVIEVAVTGGSGATRSRIADRVVVPELARIDGAGRIDVVGSSPLRASVRPRAADLAARGMSAADIEQRLRTVGRSLTAGRVREGAAVRPLVVAEPVRSPEELGRITIGSVPLREVADVDLREIGDETTFRLLDHTSNAARDGVLLRIYRAPNANAVALASGVRERVAELGTRIRDAEVSVVVDRSGDVSRALAELALAALFGVLLGTVILRWMIGHWSPTLALAVVIPAALLASFTALYAAGIPLDVISLSGLALATGLLVDNSIVVLESIETARAGGARDAVLAGTRQIILAVVASSITLIIVFAPLLYLRGLARAIFGEQAIAVVISVAASLLLSLTLTPVLARRQQSGAVPRYPGLKQYVALLDRALVHPARALLMGCVLIAAGLAVGLLLRRELFARGTERNVSIEIRMSPDLDPAIIRSRLTQAWSAALAAIDRRSVTSMWLTQTTAGKPAAINIEFASSSDAERALDRIRSPLSALDGVRATARLRPNAFIEAVGGQADRVEIILSAATEREVDELAGRATAAMLRHGLPLAHDASDPGRRLEVALRWDERLLSANGTDRAVIENDVRAALGNLDRGQADIAAAESPIRLLPTTPEDVAVTPVHVGKDIVPLSAVARLELAPRRPALFRDERRPARRLLFEGSDVDATNAALAEVAPHGSESIRLAGHARELRDAFAQMRLALVLAAVLLYLTIAAFYETLLLPLAVIAALPFAGAGALAALFVTGQSLNIMSLLGLIFLGGVVVNHTVVLLDRVEHLRGEGVAEDEAIRRAAADRYRPVIMTTLTAIVGMLPLAALGGPGVELRRGIAVVVIGGLATATAGTLVLIPLLHRVIEPLRRRSRRTVHA